MTPMSNDTKPERLWIRTEDGIHHITGWGKLSTNFNPTADQEYMRKDLAELQLAEQRKEIESLQTRNNELSNIGYSDAWQIGDLKKEIEELRRQVESTADTEADGYIFCGKCGKNK